jgi:hypothetical protein
VRYLISYDADSPRTDRLRKELVSLGADPTHRWAWTLESELAATEVLRQLMRFVDAADSLLVVDVTGRELAVGHGPDRTILPDTADVFETVPPPVVQAASAPPVVEPPLPALEVVETPIAPVTVVEVPIAPQAAEPGEPPAS